MTISPDAAEQSTCTCVLGDFLSALGLADGSAALASTAPSPEAVVASPGAGDDPLAIFDAAPPATAAVVSQAPTKRPRGVSAADDYLSVFN